MDDLIGAVNKIIDNATASKRFFSMAEGALRDLDNALAGARQTLQSAQSPSESQSYAQIALEDTLSEAPNIGKKEVEQAVLKNSEYAYLPFLTPLVGVMNNPELYKMIMGGTGWSRTLSVTLAMDEVAGTIDEYAQAVDEAREEMGAREGRDPIKASKIWRNKIWPTRGKAGPYQHVISTRMALSPGEAPFWSLLNDGNKNVDMSSDIGGIAYPSNSGTHFVQNIEKALRDLFKSRLNRYKSRSQEQIGRIEELINQLQLARTRLQRTIDDLALDIEKAKAIESRFRTHTIKDVDPSKLLKAVEDYRAGKLSDIERINIGKSGIRVRVSPSTLALYE